jgi:hypothetical protein
MLPSVEEERKRYEQHHNSIEDEGYVQFLQQAILAVQTYLKPSMLGLDYGCGPEPVLSQLLLRDHQLKCDHYDPYFFPEIPTKRYDVIFSTETFEHFFCPGKELLKLRELMLPQAYLCVMTKFYDSVSDFESWWYRRDMTHVCFYHRKTFHYIAATFGFHLLYQDQKQLIILQKT